MSKAVITRTWIGGMIAIALGFVIAGVATALGLAYGGTFTAAPDGHGYHFIPTFNAYFWSMVGVLCAGAFVLAGGAIAQFVAWIGALVNSYQLPDKLWFVITLLLGLVGFGLVVMIVYIVAAPDGYEVGSKANSAPSAPATLATQL